MLNKWELPMKPVYIYDTEVKKTLTMDRCIALMDSVFVSLSEKSVIQPLRTAMPLVGEIDLLGIMPGSLSREGVMGAKVISIFPKNNQYGKYSHQGIILLFDSSDGQLLSIIDAETITAMRTAAVSAVATREFAITDTKEIAILGAGVQGGTHLHAISLVRTFEKVMIWDISPQRSIDFAMKNSPLYPFSIEVADNACGAVTNADIICTVTSSVDPILKGVWVKPGTHINAVGACTPKTRELDSDLILQSQLFTDKMESLHNESGDFLIPRNEGIIDDTHVKGELGDVLTGKVEGRISDDDITLFKSLGLAVEDLIIANDIYKNTLETNQ